MFVSYRPNSNVSESFHADRPETSDIIDAKAFFNDSVAEFIGRTTEKEKVRMRRWAKAARKRV